MIDNKKNTDSNLIKNKGSNHRKKNLSLILVLLGVYSLVALIVAIICAPQAISAIERMVWNYYDYNSESIIIVFVSAFLVFVTMISIYIYIYSKERKRNIDDSNSILDISTYADYTEERKYLEKKIDELTIRLTQTEDRWKDINHLVLAANNKNSNNNGQIYSDVFLKEFGIDISNVKVENDLVFVLTPADKEFLKDYITVKSTCFNIKLRTLRGDEQDLSYTKNSMLGHILEYIVKSRIIIANISNRNPNVYYELGIAHMMGKPSILICRNNTEIPFDIQQKYIIFYENQEELSKKLNDALLNMLTV